MIEFLSNLCIPAMVYLILIIIGIILFIVSITLNPEAISLFILISFMIGLFIKIIWLWLLNFMCMKNQEGVAWFLFFLPYIILGIFIYIASNHIDNLKNFFYNTSS